MLVDEKLISYLEELSCFTLSSGEKKRLAGELEMILNGIDKLKELDTGGAGECVQTFSKVNVFREDEARPFIDRELILKNAPRRNDEMIIAPKTVE